MTKKKGSALSRPVKISAKLTKVIGKGPMPRTQVTKKIWAYIKKNDLQHPTHKSLIELDDKLETILRPSKTFKKGKKSFKCPAGHIWMMDMTKQLSKHIESASVKVNPSAVDDDDYEYEDQFDDDGVGYEDDEYEEEHDD